MHRRVAKFRKRVAGQLAASAIAGGPTAKLPDEALACIQGNREARRSAQRRLIGRPPRSALDRAFKGHWR